MFERIAYVSRAAGGIGTREVYDIIRRAHNRNGAAGLTGALLFLDGCFVQVLEGERFRLDDCLARIAADARHHGLELRLRASTEQRLFEHDWMALRLPEQVPEGVLAAFDYAPGLPAARFDGARTVAFVRACCGVGVPASAQA
jgi:hypothetical protein